MPDRILAVIPCFNEEAHLEKLVRQLLDAAQTVPLFIVIADGVSTDATPQIGMRLAQENPNVLYIKNPKRRQSAGINLAVAMYGNEADFLLRVDAHADYPDDYCRILIDEAERTNAASVVVGMKTAGDGWFQRAAAAAQNSKLGNGGAAHRTVGTDGLWIDHGHHALMRIAAFRAVGGYDESFAYNEDAELDTRLRRAGYGIWLTGKTSITYYPRSSPLALFRQYARYGYGRARHILKHGTPPKLRQLAPAAVLPAALLALLSPAYWLAAMPFDIWVLLCLGYGIALGIEAKSFAVAAAGPAAIIMHFGWSCGFWKGMLPIFGESK